MATMPSALSWVRVQPSGATFMVRVPLAAIPGLPPSSSNQTSVLLTLVTRCSPL
ncbi:hypothetical protein D3C77_607110 [compost metagenome]